MSIGQFFSTFSVGLNVGLIRERKPASLFDFVN